MRSDHSSAPFSLKIAAAAGLLFLHLPILLIFLYAFTTEEKSYQFPPPGYTLQWFAVAWNRPDVWEAMGLSVRVASISTAIALVLGTLCALDSQPRQLTEQQLNMLDLLAQQVVSLLEARRRNIALETFRRTLDQTPDSITIVDAQTMKYEYVNDGAARLTGYSRRELMTRNPIELLAEDQQLKLRASLKASIDAGQHVHTFETTHVDRLGNQTPVEVVLQFIPGDGSHPRPDASRD